MSESQPILGLTVEIVEYNSKPEFYINTEPVSRTLSDADMDRISDSISSSDFSLKAQEQFGCDFCIAAGKCGGKYKDKFIIRAIHQKYSDFLLFTSGCNSLMGAIATNNIKSAYCVENNVLLKMVV